MRRYFEDGVNQVFVGRVRKLAWRQQALINRLLLVVGTLTLGVLGASSQQVPASTNTKNRVERSSRMAVNDGAIVPAREFKIAQGEDHDYPRRGATVGLDIPKNETLYQANGLSSYVTTASPRTNAVAGYFQIRATGNGAKLWATNPACLDYGFAAQFSCEEIDIVNDNAASNGSAFSIGGSWGTRGAPSATVSAIHIGKPAGGTGQGFFWQYAFVSDAGASPVALYAGPAGIGKDFASQSIYFGSRDAQGYPHIASVQSDPTGALQLISPGVYVSDPAVRDQVNSPPLCFVAFNSEKKRQNYCIYEHASGGLVIGDNGKPVAIPSTVYIGGGNGIVNDDLLPQFRGTIEVTAGISDSLTITGLKPTSHCLVQPTNAKASELTGVYVTVKTGLMTLHHASVGGGTFDVFCGLT